MSTSRPRTRSDAGISLIEVMVAIVLLSVVGGLVVQAILDARSIVALTDNATQGLSDVRVASERLARDIRDARSVLCNPPGTSAAIAAADPDCLYHLQLWVDSNSDYAQQSAETVTWDLEPGAHAGQYDLIRGVAGQVNEVQARTIVVQLAFSYDTPPGSAALLPGAPHTSRVSADFSYDALVASGSTTKTQSMSARLRNVS